MAKKQMTREDKMNELFNRKKKRMSTGFVAPLLFGPLGMFYVSGLCGTVCLLLTLGLIATTAGVGAVFLWMLMPFYGMMRVHELNKELRLTLDLQYSA